MKKRTASRETRTFFIFPDRPGPAPTLNKQAFAMPVSMSISPETWDKCYQAWRDAVKGCDTSKSTVEEFYERMRKVKYPYQNPSPENDEWCVSVSGIMRKIDSEIGSRGTNQKWRFAVVTLMAALSDVFSSGIDNEKVRDLKVVSLRKVIEKANTLVNKWDNKNVKVTADDCDLVDHMLDTAIRCMSDSGGQKLANAAAHARTQFKTMQTYYKHVCHILTQIGAIVS